MDTVHPNEIHGQVPPVPTLETDELCKLLETYPVGRAIGAFWLQPWRLDFEWFLRPGPDPRPISSLDLARIVRSIESGGTVLVLATEQSALDIAIAAVEAEVRVGHA